MSSVAAIDIGSNSVRLLVADGSGREVCREMHITRLAEGVDRTGELGEAAMARTLTVLSSFGATISAGAVTAVAFLATGGDEPGAMQRVGIVVATGWLAAVAVGVLATSRDTRRS